MNYCGAAEKRSNSLLENLLESPTDLRNDKNPRIPIKTANCKCKLDTRMNKNSSAQAGLDCHTASTAGAVKDAAGKAQPVP